MRLHPASTPLLLLSAAIAAVVTIPSAVDAAFSGKATTYGTNDFSGGACSLRQGPSGVTATYFAAMNKQQYGNACGRCISVKGAKGTAVTAFVADLCNECGQNNLDLSGSLWTAVTGKTPGIEPITWDFVSCPSPKPALCLKEGSNNYWLAVQAANVRDGVSQLTIAGQKGTMVGTTAFYSVSTSGDVDLNKVSVTVTSIGGQKATYTAALKVNQCTAVALRKTPSRQTKILPLAFGSLLDAVYAMRPKRTEITKGEQEEMASSDVALEELEARLLTFTQQLESIHELLESDAENVEFLGIARDLVEVIRLTKEMIDLKLSGGDEQSQQAKASAAADSQQQKADPELAELRFSPGTICEAQSKGVWYPAFIESVTSSNTYNVHYLGFGNKDELGESSLRAVPAVPQIPLAGALPPKHAITVGFKCEAKYYVDSQFYSCSVTQVTDHGFQVLFDGYGNSEEVPYEYMRALAPTDGAGSSAAASGSATSAAGAKPSAGGAGKVAAKPFVAVIEKPIKVPENLQILPTDSEAEKERKRKRLRAIKSLNRHKTIDNERNLKQNDWKSFQHKAQKKKLVKGASGVLSKRGTSIFASPETVGGRVGVVGSGQGMTTFQDGRKKIKTSTGIPGPGALH